MKLRKQLRTQIARYVLSHPKISLKDLAKVFSMRLSQMRYYTGFPTPRPFLLMYGGELATEENIKLVLSNALRSRSYIAHRSTTSNGSSQRTGEATIPSLPPHLRQNLKALGAHECQFVVSFSESPFYCGRPVTGLYCATHDVLVKEQERKRFGDMRSV